MLSLAWDFFLSLSIRAVFTVLLVLGVDFLAWTHDSWRTGYWKDEPQFVPACFAFAGVFILVGLAGVFRRGRAESNFSVMALASIVAGAEIGHIHVPDMRGRGRTLRRFPSIESFVLGAFLIVLWLAVAYWKEEAWFLRYGAIIGAAQIVWGLMLEYFSRAQASASMNAQIQPRPSVDGFAADDHRPADRHPGGG